MLWLYFLALSYFGGSLAAADKQLYFSRKAPFIKFDSKDSEVEIELGVSVPVVKIPLVPEEGRKESGISISAPGLVVAGVLLFTTFVFVPLLFHRQIHKDFKSDDSALKRIEREVLDFPHYSSCAESLLCWTAKASKDGKAGIIGNWINGFVGSEWMGILINGTLVEEAIQTGRRGLECGKKYPNCPLTKNLASTPTK